MQDEINHKVVALSVSTGKTGARMTAAMLKAAMRKFLQLQKKHAKVRPDHKVGKQSVKELMKQNTGLSNIEITDKNIKSFERIASKYGIDYSLKKDMNAEKPHYIVFFKARDVDVMTKAFEEYTSRSLKRDKKPSVILKLKNYIAQSQSMDQKMQHEKTRQKDRGMQL